MSQSCPISGETRDEHVARAVAALVVVIVAASALIRGAWAAGVLLALALDFAVRGFSDPRYSPVATVARGIARGLLRLPPKPVDAAPKRFAARIGLLLSAVSAVLFLAGSPTTGVAVAGVLAFCATLEAAFAFCLGCRIYALLPDGLRRIVV